MMWNKVLWLGCTFLVVSLLVGCSDDNSVSAPAYDTKDVSFEKDKKHEGFVLLGAKGHFTTVGAGREDVKPYERTAMKVFFDYDFSISEHEITQEEYSSVMGGIPAEGNEKRPIANVTYNDVIIYANEKSKKEGYDTVYTFTGVEYDEFHHVLFLENLTFNPEVEGYRLPTEAEWIFAASQGWDSEQGWNDKNSARIAHDVCTQGKNDVGLCDMAGNLAEWVNDWLGYFQDTTVTNYVGAPNGSERILKGGNYLNPPSKINRYSRGDTYTVTSSTMADYVGARLAFGRIENPVWIDGNGVASSTVIKSLATASTIKDKLGTLRAKLAFVNGLTNNLVYLNFNEGAFKFKEIEDTLAVKHPDISPDGEWVAFCTGEEGTPASSQVYVRRLNVAGTDLVKLDVENAAVPRFRVNADGDTLIVYVSNADNNKSDAAFAETSTWQVSFANGKFGKPEKLFDGAYHGGISEDNRLAVSGARILRARIAKGKTDDISHKDSKDTVWYNGEQACNVSMSQDSSKRTLFLDFGSKTGTDYVGREYYDHEYMFVVDSTGKLIQGIQAPKKMVFDYTEWVNDRNLAVASIRDANGLHPKMVLIDLKDSSLTELAQGDEILFPCLRVREFKLPKDDFVLDLDSAGVYITPSSDITTRIMKVKMDYFWQYRDVINVAVVGSSRSFSGLDPTEIKSNFTMNLAYSAQDLTSTEFFTNNYFIPLMPKLKAVVITLDYDRWYVKDENWNAWFGNIPGYRYDESHDFWKHGVPESLPAIARSSLSPDEDEYSLFGYNHGLYRSGSEGWMNEDPEVSYDVNWYRNHPESYEYNRKKLVSILEFAKENNIIIIGAVFPQSPYYTKKGVWGRYGLTLDDAKKIEKDMESLEEEFSNFHIFDEYKNGDNDYEYEDFSNEDHLGLKGAVKVARRLDVFLEKILDK